MRARVKGYLRRIRDGVRESFAADHTPPEVAGSFALGVFITMLPTLGTGLVLFVILSYLFARINRIALFASVLVLNPAVKWGVYGASITLGVFLLGPVDGIEGAAVSLDAGWDVLVRLWVGNLVLAAIATVIGYVVVYRMVVSYRHREFEIVETVIGTDSTDSESAATDDRHDPDNETVDAE
ncbi:DUF2062 domain-containing protein [Halohasta litorea]|uniref:DUF2062 domain-containing protein n=1 Tax=Halohasta litorea TaxID=869891 RepID=A0ABD6DAZ3_9EURY|nr:DUF2062 domain-containing protein [Halohasta litorea]